MAFRNPSEDRHAFPEDAAFSNMFNKDERRDGGAPRTRQQDSERLVNNDETIKDIADEEYLLPTHTWVYSDGFIITLYVFLILLLLSIFGFCLWGGLRADDEGDCQNELVKLGDKKTNLKIRFVRETIELLDCLNFCNVTSCDSCCPACDGFPAPDPPPSGHPDNPGITTTADDCPNWAYGAFVSSTPSSLCRFGPISVSICGFSHDETISILETPLTPTPQFTQGTVLASARRDSLANGLLCKPHNAVTGPNGLSRFTVRGDQTGFSIRFVSTIISSTTCPTLICPSVI